MLFKKKKTMNDKDQNQEQPIEEVLNPQAAIENNEELEVEATEEISVEDKLRAELAASKDQYLRLVAEFDNFRKRTAKEKQEIQQLATKDVMKSLVEVLDDSERAAKTIENSTDVAALRDGVNLVLGKLNSILFAKGLKAMETAIGTDFDAELHEAITEIPASKPELSGKVVDVIEKGYYLNEKLIRHAKVVVGK